MFQSILTRMARSTIFGKSPVGLFLRLNRWVWNYLPSSLTTLRPVRLYGILLHTLVCLRAIRRFNFGTFFLRNRPELELIRRLSEQKGKDSTLTIAVLACSKGAEVYSILWAIRSKRPDLKVIMNAVDISKGVLEFAQRGVYSLKTHELVNLPIFERMTSEEMQEMFVWEGDRVKIQSWLKNGIIWHLGDAGNPELRNVFGPQDMVVANNFLCHMDPQDAERYLRSIARLVKPGGYLFISGIDLDIRTKVARNLGWDPIPDLMEEIHDGDTSLRVDWPWEYWGLEPLNKRRPDWQIRYAQVFQLGETNDAESSFLLRNEGM